MSQIRIFRKRVTNNICAPGTIDLPSCRVRAWNRRLSLPQRMVSLRLRSCADVHRDRRPGMVFPCQVDATAIPNGLRHERCAKRWKVRDDGERRCRLIR